MLLFGGVGPGLEAADLWRFDGTDWKLLVGDLGIGSRSMTAAVFSDGTLTVVGGTGGPTTADTSRFLNDVLTIDVATGNVQTTGESEEALWRHTAAAEAGTDGIVVIALGKTLRYEPSTGEWTDLTPTSDL